ncbi:3-polyprenyl-4-hydroxybenzoate carboxy-lyase UbiX [Caballeronia sordidicola]|uniref:3-polyprenyl-4-hydroxybenzoate carboxy-lyase UbiX n=1 Tax=Caballeronia sordidicola TaxID=196367 RepID=A0A242MR66_CABSO|nr:3-polyprenyl-4-hydroxybenzoate carboxy-lyase UbiX [Caballeronia sordidicola]OTP76750.1 3-polyprenyl-4-hydroxybenzoate carboxy-lyase UbiX [Caballeronia sordidicola]
MPRVRSFMRAMCSPACVFRVTMRSIWKHSSPPTTPDSIPT